MAVSVGGLIPARSHTVAEVSPCSMRSSLSRLPMISAAVLSCFVSILVDVNLYPFEAMYSLDLCLYLLYHIHHAYAIGEDGIVVVLVLERIVEALTLCVVIYEHQPLVAVCLLVESYHDLVVSLFVGERLCVEQFAE